jgi:drug/metabolite transporter (DMT)-like permease
MNERALLLAVLTGVGYAGYSTFQKLGSATMTPALGGMIISAVAFLVNVIVLLILRLSGQPVQWSREGIGFVVLVGISAGCVDLLSLAAFGAGLPVSATIIFTAVQMVLVLAIGLVFLHESLNWTKLIGLALVAAGIFFLHRGQG